MGDWFAIERLDTDSFCISEPRHVEETNCYLLAGSERALLIDTGLGVADIRSETERLTDRPVSAVASHVHWDHIGGHGLFEEFYVHEAEKAWVEGAFPLSREAVLGALCGGSLPESFEPEHYELFSGTPARLLRDGDIIKLGGRNLEVIHTPGHSPGHICLWERERGWLFTGDTVYKGTIFAFYISTEPERLLVSVERLASLPVKRIFPAHHSRDIEADIIFRMRDELRGLKRKGLLRHGAGEFMFGDWGIRL